MGSQPCLQGGWSNNTLNLVSHSGVIFAICQLHHVHMRKDTRLSPLFCTASDEELGLGPRKKWYVIEMCHGG